MLFVLLAPHMMERTSAISVLVPLVSAMSCLCLLQVLLARVFRLGVRGDLSSRAEVQEGQLYLEVSAPAAEGEHAAPCQAIGEPDCCGCGRICPALRCEVLITRHLLKAVCSLR